MTGKLKNTWQISTGIDSANEYSSNAEIPKFVYLPALFKTNKCTHFQKEE
jgi:hypothetical protein